MLPRETGAVRIPWVTVQYLLLHTLKDAPNDISVFRHCRTQTLGRTAMSMENKIDIELFKGVSRAMAQSEAVDVMTTHLAQLLVGVLEIKGCAFLALNLETDELEVLGSFGLSIGYVNKGPIMFHESLHETFKSGAVVIEDVSKSDLLQYSEAAQKEGIQTIISIPIKFYGHSIGAMRLYHGQTWKISEQDLDALSALTEYVGLAMTYLRVVNALKTVKDTVEDVHAVWLEPAGS
jgi:transcriptional regulator with GAF, ATPase, and Fis domain